MNECKKKLSLYGILYFVFCIVFCIVQLVNGRMIIGILFIGLDTCGFLPPLPHTHKTLFENFAAISRVCV